MAVIFNSSFERWVKPVEGVCLSKLILSGESFLRGALRECPAHYPQEGNHQGKQNRPRLHAGLNGRVGARERLALRFAHGPARGGDQMASAGL